VLCVVEEYKRLCEQQEKEARLAAEREVASQLEQIQQAMAANGTGTRHTAGC